MADEPGRQIAHVILWANGMVMTFDQYGQQFEEYQGPVAEVRERVVRDAPSDTVFEGGRWNQMTWGMSRAQFASLPPVRDPHFS